MRIVDLRSDTVTKPTPEMYDAMVNAPLGDDVFGEDPSINLLQDRMASYFGHEEALFCPSGTMTNQIAIQVHTDPGDEVICSDLAHIYLYEGGGIAKNAGSSVRLIRGNKGRITVKQIKQEVNPPDDYYPKTRLISIEDTANKGGGSCYELDEIKAIGAFAKECGLGYHLDGARVWNALVARKHDPVEYGRQFDSISVCLSKGLGAPSGSVLIGSEDFIHKAHRIRKAMGGGMRQAGILAAGGLYAFENHMKDLEKDHQRADRIARFLARCSFIKEVIEPETNILIFSLNESKNANDLSLELKQKGVLALPFGPSKMRFVFHRDLNDEDIDFCEEVLEALS